jgi:hypothetical protein
MSAPPGSAIVVLEMADVGVGAWIDEADVAVVGPLRQVRRGAVGSLDLQDLGIAFGFPGPVRRNDQAFPWVGVHG